MNLSEALNWRYATKKMNGQKVPQEKIDRILEAIRLAPSSMGLQPYKVFVIENHDLRKKIQEVAYNQSQITDASHLLVFAAWDNISEYQVSRYIAQIAETRGVHPETLEAFKQNILNAATQKNSQEQNYQWNARQAYIAFGLGIAAAALEGVDATPMEGFDTHALDELLDLREKGLRSVTLLPLGYRDEENDWLLSQKKVRRDHADLFVELKEDVAVTA